MKRTDDGRMQEELRDWIGPVQKTATTGRGEEGEKIIMTTVIILITLTTISKLDATATSESCFSLFFIVCDRAAFQEESSLGCREMLL